MTGQRRMHARRSVEVPGAVGQRRSEVHWAVRNQTDNLVSRQADTVSQARNRQGRRPPTASSASPPQSHTILSDALSAAGVYLGLTRGREASQPLVVAADLRDAREQFAVELEPGPRQSRLA